MRADEAILLDMLVAARDAVSFVADSSLPEFQRDSLCVNAASSNV